jgi:hypothetical protein
MTYASVVSRESVIVALTLANLNDLDIKMSDIENSYLTAPITEKVWTVLGPEFGDDNRKLALIVRYYPTLPVGRQNHDAHIKCRPHVSECKPSIKHRHQGVFQPSSKGTYQHGMVFIPSASCTQLWLEVRWRSFQESLG